MPVADPAIVLTAAIALALILGRVPDRLNPVTALASLARSASAPSKLTGSNARISGLLLVALCCIVSVVIVRIVADALPFMLVIVIPHSAANALKTTLSAALLWCALSAPGSRFWARGSAPRSAAALSREAAAPLLLFTLAGPSAAFAWTACVAALDATSTQWAPSAARILALLHYIPARIAALAACIAAPFAGVRIKQAWAAVLDEPASPDAWHPEWVAAALEQAGDRSARLAIAAALVVAAGCLAAMVLPLAVK